MINISAYQSELVLATYHYQKINIELVGIPGRDESKDFQTYEHYVLADYNINEHASNKNLYRVTLEVASEQPNELRSTGVLPYKYSIIIVGVFELPEEIPANDRANHLHASAPSILYGIVRETLRSLTAVGNLIGYILPSVNFIEIAKKKQELEDTNKQEADKNEQEYKESLEKRKTSSKKKSPPK